MKNNPLGWRPLSLTYGISFHWSLDCLFKSLSRLSTKTPVLRHCSFALGIHHQSYHGDVLVKRWYIYWVGDRDKERGYWFSWKWYRMLMNTPETGVWRIVHYFTVSLHGSRPKGEEEGGVNIKKGRSPQWSCVLTMHYTLPRLLWKYSYSPLYM